MQILCFTSLICLEKENSPCPCTTRVPSLSVPQPVMSLGRHRWRSGTESPTLSMSLLGSSGMDRTVHSLDIHVRWQPRPSLGVQFQSAAVFQCPQKDGEEDAVLTDYQWAVFCLLTPQNPPPPLPPPPDVFITSSIRSLLHHISISHRHIVHRLGTRLYYR